jgi:hypothetical protein
VELISHTSMVAHRMGPPGIPGGRLWHPGSESA